MANVCKFLAAFLILAGIVSASEEMATDLLIEQPAELLAPPPPAKPAKNHYEALKLYLKAHWLQEGSNLADAVRAYEQILQLEPDSVAIYKVLVPLCFQLERDEQALEYCQKAMASNAADFDLLSLYGQEMKRRGKLDEAAEALAKAVQMADAKEHPDQLAQMSFDLGMLYEDLKQFSKAATAYEQVVKILEDPEMLEELDPAARKQIAGETAKTYERLGRVRLQAAQYDKAVAAFQGAKQKDAARAARLNYHLAEVYLAKNEPAKALDELRQYLRTHPTGGEPYEMLVKLLTQLGRQNEIVPALEKAVVADSFNQPLKLVLARQCAEAGQAAKAEQLFLGVWKDNPSEEAYRGLAKLYHQQNRCLDLAAMLDKNMRDGHLSSVRPQLKVLAEDPTLSGGVAAAMISSGQAYTFNTRRFLATMCRQAKHYDQAVALCRMCLKDDPRPGEVYIELCRVLGEARKFEELARICEEASRKTLQVPASVFEFEHARALSLAGKESDAVAAAQVLVRKAKPESEEHFRASFVLATVYYRSNQFDEAVAHCEKLLEDYADEALQRQAHYLLSGIYSAQHDYAKSEEHLRKVLAIDPDDPGANNDLGYTYAEQGKNLEEAEKLIRKAIELDRLERGRKRGTLDMPEADKDSAAYIDSLGWVLFKKGQPQEACKQLERATKLSDGEDPAIWDHLGDVYQRLNRPTDARSAWQKAAELYETTSRVGVEDRLKQVQEKLETLQRTTKK